MASKDIKKIAVGNLELAYLETGEGPLVLCLHGYPDTAESWLGTMQFLVTKGYRVIAPYLRGYYPSHIPEDDDYSVLSLAEDVLGLMEALGETEAILIGHDWGALAGYAAASLAPEKIKKLITLDMAHPRTIRFTPRTVWKGRHIMTYQFKKSAVRRLKQDNFAHIDAIYRRWSPNWDFDAQETAVVKQAFAKPGRAEAALGYYWSFAADLRGNNQRAETARTVSRAKINVPTLCIVGDWGAIDKVQMEQTLTAFTGQYEYVILPGIGHFLHREAPEKFLMLIDKFL